MDLCGVAADALQSHLSDSMRERYPFSRAGFGGSVKDCDLLYAGVCVQRRGLGAGGLAFVYQKIANEANGGLRYATYRLGKSKTDWLSRGAGIGYLRIGDDP